MKEVDTAAAYLREHLPFAPELALVLGSGLGGLAERIENAVTIPYREVPGFPLSTAPGHAGQFVAGMLGGKRVLCMQGGSITTRVTICAPLRCRCGCSRHWAAAR